MRHLLTGRKPVKIGVVGGSIIWGNSAERGVDDFFTVFSGWVRHAFPRANITTRNGALPGTDASYMVMCLDIRVDPDVDVVFFEYVLNNGFMPNIMDNPNTMVQEKLVRRILAHGNNPAIVFIQVSRQL